MNSSDQKLRTTTAASLLHRAAQTIRILTHIAWPQRHREQFLKNNSCKLPEITYPPFDPTETIAHLAKARQHIVGESAIDTWLSRIADKIETSARMLSASGTPEFHEHSHTLYGAPTGKLRDESSTSLDLAVKFDELFTRISHVDVGAPAPACYLADYVAERMRQAVDVMFGDLAPEVSIVDELSANALAGPKRIRIRRGAYFTDKDVLQLIHHEAHIHVATSLNGIAQENLKILGASHPGSTKTQEGLAVFSEFISGSMDIDRFRRLADRIIAIQMAIEGADFVDVFRYFLERVEGPEQAFENTRRVFRGGTVDGGAPFTKDIVYLDGLLRVHNFLRAIVGAGRADCLQLLFCGKLDVEDIPVLCELAEMGLCTAPKFLPPWAADRRFLLSYLAYSSYLNSIDLSTVRNHYKALLADSPIVDMSRQYA
ncbi:MAG: flavohemoglobin expression-modulating QEGLA motif protein [Gammaproteobacteria bacterium]|nr:flavohemoglobin expression-modulating QEGLA motif protein [Gammaproteobacteria bacterium]